MEQLPHSDAEGLATPFTETGPPFHAYDAAAFLPGADHPAFADAAWGVPANAYPGQSRASQPAASNWPPPAAANAPHHHLATGSGPGQGSPYPRSVSQSPAPFVQSPYGSFAARATPGSNVPYHSPAYDPALFTPSTTGPDFHHGSYPAYGHAAQQHLRTIAPQALQQQGSRPLAPSHGAYGGGPVNYGPSAVGQSRGAGAAPPAAAAAAAAASAASTAAAPTATPAPTTAPPVDQGPLVAAIPASHDTGHVAIVDFDQLVRATNSERMGNYVNIGREAHEWPINRTTSLPQYAQRRSKNELRKAAGTDAALLAKLGKKSSKKEKSLAVQPVTAVRPLTATAKGAGAPAEAAARPDVRASSSDESSDGDDDEDDDDDESYTSGEDVEGSPLPSKRPEHPKDAVEYDTIKALWRPKRRPVDSAAIKKGILGFWEIVKTIRDRWKTDSAAVTEAEEKKRAGELPLLRSRVKDQRDMIESAFKAALKHGHRNIVELLGENSSLVYLCYQFLLDRFKADDLNSALPRAMLETMSLFTTMDHDVLEKTHLDKVLVRYAKKGDAKTQFYAKRITQNAAAASKEKADPAAAAALSSSSSSKPLGAAKGAPSAPSPTKRADPEPVAGSKRSASTAVEGGGPPKKVATGAPKVNGAGSTAKPSAATTKKPAAAADSPKASAATAVPATKTKQVTAKPSSFFSSLQSAKKPGTSIKAGTPVQAAGAKSGERKPAATAAATAAAPTAPSAAPKSTFSFAETMANLSKPKEEKPAAKPVKERAPEVPETPEEKAKRLRKEARRKLHVSFKVGEDLVQVRYFTHDPEEEIGHDSSQMRDVSDAGGEGRALKQHQAMMDFEDDDDGEDDRKLVDFREPTPIDFSVIDAEERQKMYSKFGGGALEPQSPERAAREQHEANTLIVIYTDEKDIPPNPKEPKDPYSSDLTIGAKNFGPPDQQWYDVASKRTAPGQHGTSQQPAPSSQPAFDLSKFINGQQQQQQQQQPPPQPPPPPPPSSQPATQTPPTTTPIDIQSILAQLKLPTAPQPQPQQPQTTVNFAAALQPAPAVNGMQSQSAPQSNGPTPDLSAILAAIGGQQAASQAPQLGSFGAAPSAPPMMNFAPQGQQSDQTGGGASGGGGSSGERKRWRDQGEKNKFYKTKVCRYWQEGRCMKGDGCTYLHEEPQQAS